MLDRINLMTMWTIKDNIGKMSLSKMLKRTLNSGPADIIWWQIWVHIYVVINGNAYGFSEKRISSSIWVCCKVLCIFIVFIEEYFYYQVPISLGPLQTCGSLLNRIHFPIANARDGQLCSTNLFSSANFRHVM